MNGGPGDEVDDASKDVEASERDSQSLTFSHES